MELTGQCKKDFEKWWHNQTSPALTGELHHFGVYCKKGFSCLTESMKYGVYVDFFLECKDRYIEIYSNASGWGFMITKGGFNGTCIYEIEDDIFFESLNEARIKSIEKANLIYNNKKQ